jgi:hypothetical protein
MSYLPAQAAAHEIYGLIHKGLRYAHARLLTRLGATAPDNGAAVAELLADLQRHLASRAGQIGCERREILAPLRTRAPGAVTELAEGHDRRCAHLPVLERLIAEVGLSRLRQRGAALDRLYLAFSRFVAEDLHHMAEEQEEFSPVLQALFTDAELDAMEARMRAGLTAEQLIDLARIMLPAARPDERLAMLRTVRADMVRENAPPESFAVLLALGVRPALAAADWAQLEAGLAA